MTEKNKMLSGKLYNHTDFELTSERDKASNLMHRYNKLSEYQQEERREILLQLLGDVGDNVIIKPPFMVDYGYNISIGNNFFANYGFTVLDCNKVEIGNNVLIGPNVQIYPATHPIDPNIRRKHLEFADSIKIGNDVWIGGGSIICAGVTIGDNTTIGAGSIVTKNIPSNVVAVGNPCKVIKKIPETQNEENPIEFIGLGHINIVVEDIDKGMNFYRQFLGAKPIQMFRNFKNIGFSKAAGFIENPDEIVLSIAFMKIPHTNLTLELMEYYNPKTKDLILNNHSQVQNINGVKHIALAVKDVYKAYEHAMGIEGVRPINLSKLYKPHKIDKITDKEITLFDEENTIEKKINIVNTVSNTHYCYVIDKYGVQWEFEQGHTDMIN